MQCQWLDAPKSLRSFWKPPCWLLQALKKSPLFFKIHLSTLLKLFPHTTSAFISYWKLSLTQWFSRKFVLSLSPGMNSPQQGSYPVCTHHCSPGAAGAWSAPAWPGRVPGAAGSSWTPLLSSPRWSSQPARWSSAPPLPESCKHTDKRFLESSQW